MTEAGTIDTDKRTLDRTLFFSDAVFAIALTLLVLELRPPPVAWHDDAALRAALASMSRPFVAFFGSFAIIAQWWALHVRITRKLIQFDWLTTVLNLPFLLFVVLMPFGTSLLGSDNGSATAFEIYWLINAGASVSLAAMFLVMSRGGGRLMGGITFGQRAFRFLRTIGSGIAFAAGVWFAAHGQVLLSGFSWVLMFPIFMLIRVLQTLFRVRT